MIYSMSLDDLTTLRRENRVLEMVATGAAPEDSLAELIAAVEAREPGIRCGVLMVADHGTRFAGGVGPSIPQAFHDRLGSVRIMPPYLGPCPQAVHSGAPVVVADVARETRYTERWRAAMRAEGIAASRSTPVRGPDGRVLASFAVYGERPGDPRPADPGLICEAAHLTAIVMGRERKDAALRRTEAALRHCETEFRTLAEHLPNPCWMADASGWVYWCNKRWYAYTGAAPAEAEGWSWDSVCHPGSLQAVTDRWQGSVAAGLPFEMTFPMKGADGAFRRFLTRIAPVRDANGLITKWLANSVDVSPRDGAAAL